MPAHASDNPRDYTAEIEALQNELETLRFSIDDAHARDHRDTRTRSILNAREVRAQQLVGRIQELSHERDVRQIKAELEKRVGDVALRQELTTTLTEILDKRINELRDAAQDPETLAHQRLALRERTWEMRKSLLEREPAAVLIGGLLLMIMATGLLVGMFTHTSTPEIISSAFLLILGFFFGQSTNRGATTAERNE
ncbi:hypothetical protein [Nocardia blacklockiae]|uniref:hypothetical protein n=1 Tax=Nocardia blacklockiae TaxID=480036 RepID=UPI0018954298|nr:hypothetical protein [Nocardia blacklockiae]MBF6173375.1 hypothetical protein [Nocardia blacklockiae]